MVHYFSKKMEVMRGELSQGSYLAPASLPSAGLASTFPCHYDDLALLLPMAKVSTWVLVPQSIVPKDMLQQFPATSTPDPAPSSFYRGNPINLQTCVISYK